MEQLSHLSIPNIGTVAVGAATPAPPASPSSGSYVGVATNGQLLQWRGGKWVDAAISVATFITIAIPHTQKFEYVHRHTFPGVTAAGYAVRAWLKAENETAENDAFETASWRVTATTGAGYIDFLITAPSHFGGQCTIGFKFEEPYE